MAACEPDDDGEDDEEKDRAHHRADDAEGQPDTHLELGRFPSSRCALGFTRSSATGSTGVGHSVALPVGHDARNSRGCKINIGANLIPARPWRVP